MVDHGIIRQVFDELLKPQVIIYEMCLVFIIFKFQIKFTNNGLEIHEDYVILIGGSQKIDDLFSDKNKFFALSLLDQKCILDILWIVLHRSLYDVARFCCYHDGPVSFTHKLLKILVSEEAQSNFMIYKRVIRLISCICSCGITGPDLMFFVSLLRTPSMMTISLLQSLKIMSQVDGGIVKASPSSFFNFGGSNSGIYVPPFSNPLTREYQMCCWFRIESFHITQPNHIQHIFTLKGNNDSNLSNTGIDIFIENKALCISISENLPPTKCTDQSLQCGIWYHLSIRHSKPRMLSLFARDEIVVYLDHQIVFQDHIKFPFPYSSGSATSLITEMTIGKHFNGEMGPIYIFSEIVPQAVIEALSRLNAGKSCDEITPDMQIDLLSNFNLVDPSTKKLTYNTIFGKLVAAYHPARCTNNIVVDIHNNRSGVLGTSTKPWLIHNVRDTIISVGGLTCLLPMFPKLLIENELVRQENIAISRSLANISYVTKSVDNPKLLSHAVSGGGSAGLGTSMVETLYDSDLKQIFTPDTVELMQQDHNELSEDKPIALMFSILARCIRGHTRNQRDIVRLGGIEMIEYVLTGLTRGAKILKDENESCILALLQLRMAASDCLPLDRLIVKRLLCNFHIWSSSSYELQCNLFSVILANIKAQPDFFLQNTGVQVMIDAIHLYYLNNNDEVVNSPLESEHDNDGNKRDDASVRKIVLMNNSSGRSVGVTGVTNNLRRSIIGGNVNSLSGSEGVSPSFKLLVNRRMSTATAEAVSVFKNGATPHDFNAENEAKMINHEFSGENNDLPPLASSGTEQFRNALSREISCRFDKNEVGDSPMKEQSKRGMGKLFIQMDDISEDSNHKSQDDIPIPPPLLSPSGMMVDFEQGDSGNDAVDESIEYDDDNENLCNITELDNNEKRKLRSCLESIIMTFINRNVDEESIKPLLTFVGVCDDMLVENEIGQILLCLLVEEDGKKICSIITDYFKGVEEFISFIIAKFINRQNEVLRCTGMAILTHYSLRVDVTPISPLYSSHRGVKTTSMFKVRDKFTASSTDGKGVERLYACGGIANISQLLAQYKDDVSESTYSVLLEMLLSTSTTTSHFTKFYKNILVEHIQRVSHSTTQIKSVSAQNIHGPSQSESYGFASTIINDKRNNFFQSVHMLDIDEHKEMINSRMLTLFFEYIPKLPLHIQERVYEDLLPLLKHNSSNRTTFFYHPLYHYCLFDLVGQLVVVTNQCTLTLSQSDVKNHLKQWAIFDCQGDDEGILNIFDAKSPNKYSSLSPFSNHFNSTIYNPHNANLPRSQEKDVVMDNAEFVDQSSSNGISSAARKGEMRRRSLAVDDFGCNKLNTWFDIGMKIYATLLLHGLDFEKGFVEFDRTISQSFDSIHGVAVSLSIFSHVLHEMSFSLSSRYREMQRLAKSSKDEESHLATITLENMVSIIVTIGTFLLESNSMAALGLQSIHNIAKSPVASSVSDASDPVATTRCTFQCSDVEHKVCMIAKDLCRDCGHSLSVHPAQHTLDLNISSDILMRELEVKYNLSQLPPAAFKLNTEPLSNDIENGINRENRITREKNLEEEHVWMHIGKDGGKPPQDRKKSSRTISVGSPSTTSKKSVSGGGDEERLGPLGRGYELPTGRMIVLHQVFRYFDLLFWPSNKGRLRNTHLLTTTKDRSKYFDPQVLKGLNKDIQMSSPQFSLYISMLRLSLYALHGMSPYSELADMNLRRMTQLVRCMEKISTDASPLDHWIIVIVTHVITALNRVHESLSSIYQILSIQPTIEVVVDGPLANMHVVIQRQEEDDKKLINSLQSQEFMNNINNVFYNTAGGQLMQYVNSAISLLVVIYEKQKSLLAKVMGDRAFFAFTLLYQKYENNEYHRDSREGINVMMNRRNSDISGSSIDATDHKLFSRGKAFSMDSEPVTDRNSTVQQDGNDANNSIAADNMSNKEFAKECIICLCWLRNPFIRLDMLQSDSTIISILAIDKFEKDCNNTFMSDLRLMKEVFIETQNETSKRRESEVEELTSLGTVICKSLKENEETRKIALKSNKAILVKSAAMHWHNCFRTFDGEWSPWASEEDKVHTQYLISTHRDASLRRLMLFKNGEPQDHSNAAYFEAKMRDQQEFESGSDAALSVASSVAGVSAPSSFVKSTLQNIRPKLSRLKSLNSWDTVDEGDDSDEASVDVTKKVERGMFTVNMTEKLPAWALAFSWHIDEKPLFSTDLLRITREQVIQGTVLLTNKYVYFHPKRRIGGFTVLPDAFKDKRWRLDRLIESYGRRYLLQNCAVELFFADNMDLFIAFNKLPELQKFIRLIRKQHTPMLSTSNSLNPRQIFQSSRWTEMWRKRRISNFEYLMRLNMMAGRSFNDITQYPVMPWIISDYTSNTIDTKDPSIYRDLSKPIGALNETRLSEIMERYKTFDDSDIPKFMYGSHYSSAGVVLHFLIRQEPFTSMAITLQGGRFDCPDRLFFDIRETWRGVNHSMSDVKELIPELFCCPEVLLNTNKLPLGELQDDRGPVEDVRLPKWANNSPYEFIRIQREALESDHVSDRLHEWINLVFGCKQTGPAAVEAKNLFYYLTYENAVDIDSIQDPLQRAATKAQVTHFGQTPSQLLLKDHPKRLPKEECMMSFCHDPIPDRLAKIKICNNFKQHGAVGEHGHVVSMQASGDRVTALYEDYSVAYYRMIVSTDLTDGASPVTLRLEKAKSLASASFSRFKREVLNFSNINTSPVIATSSSLSLSYLFGGSKGSAVQTPAPVTVSQNDLQSMFGQKNQNDDVKELFSSNHAVVVFGDSGQERILTSGYWDNTLKLHAMDTLREIESVNGGHVGEITCMALGSDRQLLVTGGKDCTCRMWVVENTTMASFVSDAIWGSASPPFGVEPNEALVPIHILWGHNSPITAVCYSSHHDLVLSGGLNGIMCLHSARKGKFIRSIHLLQEKQISLLGISELGYLVAYSASDCSLNIIWINGDPLVTLSNMPR